MPPLYFTASDGDGLRVRRTAGQSDIRHGTWLGEVAGWKTGERRLSENGRNGRCAFISAPAGEKGAYLQRLKNPVPGNYEFGCWFRTSLGKKCAQLQVTGKRAGKTAFMRSVSLPGSLEWKETSLAFQVPPDTTELIVLYRQLT